MTNAAPVTCADLPAGARLRPLRPRRDAGGCAVELFRQDAAGDGMVQWNLSRSEAGVLRGLHLHPDCAELYVLLSGDAEILLLDLRPASPTAGRRTQRPLTSARPAVLFLPAGVLHGIHFTRPSLLLIGRSREFDGQRELACRWDDPDLGEPWLAQPPVLSDSDAAAGSLAALRHACAAAAAPA
jgi:dTDP-4-dehydrorhamnose 3,5-epimerase